MSDVDNVTDYILVAEGFYSVSGERDAGDSLGRHNGTVFAAKDRHNGNPNRCFYWDGYKMAGW